MEKHSSPKTTVVLWGGLDPGGRAGLAADLQMADTLGAIPRIVLTARTAQSDGVWRGAWATSNRERAAVVATLDLPNGGVAFKSGMLATQAHARALVRLARKHPGVPLVVDPLLQTTSGGWLWTDSQPHDAAQFLRTHVLPWSQVVTPNWPELEALAGRALTDEQEARAALARLPCAAVLKGGHAPGRLTGVDLVWDGHAFTELPAAERWTRSPRGTGCRFATALAIELARGASLVEAAASAKAWVHRLVAGG